MAVTSGTVWSVNQLRQDDTGDDSGLRFAEVYFTMSGTYAQADNSQLLTVTTLIQNSKRNGKTVTLVQATCGKEARKTTGNTIMALKTVAVSGSGLTFELTDGDYTTELANGAIPAHNVPFCAIVSYTEA